MKERLPNIIKQAQDHLDETRPVVLTSHRPNKTPLKFTEEDVDAEMEWIIYTSRPGGKGIGA